MIVSEGYKLTVRVKDNQRERHSRRGLTTAVMTIMSLECEVAEVCNM